MKMSKRLYWNETAVIGLSLDANHEREMLQECTKSFPNETGGILIGLYKQDNTIAEVTKISGPPKDSKHGRYTFYRGTLGLIELLDEYWEKHQQYYLGEWHFHPNGKPVPSHQDILQMKQIANSKRYNCPEPILLIVGGHPKKQWTTSAYVFPKGKECITLPVWELGK